jgi:hypothetical protein
MQEFDVDAFITELERLGLKLTATRLLDGTYRVNRWGMPDVTHAQQIEDLWAKHIADDKARMILLGTHVARRSSNRRPNVNQLLLERTPLALEDDARQFSIRTFRKGRTANPGREGEAWLRPIGHQ